MVKWLLANLFLLPLHRGKKIEEQSYRYTVHSRSTMNYILDKHIVVIFTYKNPCWDLHF
ncbi:unnamed protein product [Lupinus luteus]|uniref:Uncharacterized protein n=1 Tax=Lupinus luteus TaxID=3873 RepID=A0AAV1XDI3_LUPLU